MKKSIESARVKNLVANKVIVAIKKELNEVFGEDAEKVEVNKTYNFTEVIISSPKNYKGMITSSELEIVTKAIKPFTDKYYNVTWSIDTDKKYNAESETWIYYPVMNVDISVKAGNWDLNK